MARAKIFLVIGMICRNIVVHATPSEKETCGAADGGQCASESMANGYEDDDAAAMLQIRKMAVSENMELEELENGGDRFTQQRSAARAAQIQDARQYVSAISKTQSSAIETQMAEMASQIYLPKSTADWSLMWHRVIPSTWKYDNDIVGIYERHVGSAHYCTMAFAGSNHGFDFISNVNILTTDYCGIKNHKIHKGFVKELSNFWPNAKSGVDMIINQKKCGGGLYVVGHSLGAAIAEIFAACIHANWKPPSMPEIKGVYTLAAPGVSKTQLTDTSSAGVQRAGCFPGKRFYIQDTVWEDAVPAVTRPFGFEHPKLKAVRLRKTNYFWSSTTYIHEDFACDSNNARVYPNDVKIPSITLHGAAEHVTRIKKIYGR